MATHPTVNVTTPTGGSEAVPASVVDAPAGAPTYGDTGTGSNPVAPAKVSKLGPLASKSFPGVIAAVAASETRETQNDSASIGRLNDLLKVLKAIQDGNISKNGVKGLNPDAFNEIAFKSGVFSAQFSGDPYAQMQGGVTTPKSEINALKKAAVGAIREKYMALGVDPGNASNFNTLSSLPGLNTLTQNAQRSRGATAPLAPLTRTTGLLTLLDDLETGKPTTNVNPSVWHAMMSRAGVPGGGQGVGYLMATGDDSGDLGPGANLAPSTQQALKTATVRAIQTHMIDLGADPADVQDAMSAKALKAVTLPSHLHSMAGTDGYNLDNVTTFGSFFQALDKQSIKTKGGLGIPGQVVTSPARPSASGSGQQFFDAFKSEWQRSAAYRGEVASALTTAGIDPTPIGSSQADYAQAANALIKVMQKTPNGENPWAYLKAQPVISAAELHTNQGYALALAESTKIGAKLSNDQLNRLAQIYGGSTTTGNTDAMDQAIASLYRYDPNEDTQPGSFAATALQNIQQTFGSYGIALTNAQAGSYVQQLLTKGGADLTSIYSAGDAATAYATDVAKQAASSLFPTLAPLINSGQTLTGSGGMLTPYISQYAQMLGKDPDTITLTPQLIKLMAAGETGTSSSVGQGAVGGEEALQTGIGKQGQKGATSAPGGLKSLDQFQAAVMQDPSTGWDKSPSALEAYTNIGNSLMSTMGFAPPQGPQTPGTPQSTNLVGGQV